MPRCVTTCPTCKANLDEYFEAEFVTRTQPLEYALTQADRRIEWLERQVRTLGGDPTPEG